MRRKRRLNAPKYKVSRNVSRYLGYVLKVNEQRKREGWVPG